MSFATRSAMAAAAMGCIVLSLGAQFPTPSLGFYQDNTSGRRAMKPKASKKKRGKGR